MLIGWVLIVPVLVYLPINVQRRMSEAVIVPLAILAAAGLHALAERGVPGIGMRRGGRGDAADQRSTAARRCAGSVDSATPLFQATRFGLPAQRPLLAGEIVLMRSRPATCSPRGRICTPTWGTVQRRSTGSSKPTGWNTSIPDVMTASERDTFFANPCALTFPCAGAIRYVMFGPLERALAPDGDPAWAAGLTKIYDLGAYAIYATGR
ncbi:MAG: hypothetical protein U0521_14335 [Anaerolineae bacterium]